MARKVLILLFFGLGLYYVFLFETIDSSLKMVFKLLPMILLIALAFLTKVQVKSPYYWLISTGLIFCAVGDYTLQWFIVGLSFFLDRSYFLYFCFPFNKPPEHTTVCKSYFSFIRCSYDVLDCGKSAAKRRHGTCHCSDCLYFRYFNDGVDIIPNRQ